MTRGDLVVLVACAALVGGATHAVWVPRGTATHVVLAVRDAPSRTLPLAVDATYEVVGRRGTTRVEVAGGRVRVTDSACPQKICVRAGWLTHAGESTACLPNGVLVRLTGGEPAYDAITG